MRDEDYTESRVNDDDNKMRRKISVLSELFIYSCAIHSHV